MSLDPAALPAAPGAYLLAVRLPRPLVLRLPATGTVTLEAGTYLYAGSARGPGGIRARVGHHLRRGKRAHWHVDRLTAAGRVVAVAVAPGGSECALFAAVSGLSGALLPAPGFGSSDCRRCAAHLAQVDEAELAGPALDPIVTWLHS